MAVVCLRLASREFGTRSAGIEIGPRQCPVSWVRAWLSGNRDRVRTRYGNFYEAGFQDADAVFIYLTSSQTARLQPLLEQQLRPGARVVSIAAEIPGWQPALVDRAMLIFVYAIQPSSTEPP
jgi:hypothetical protein